MNELVPEFDSRLRERYGEFVPPKALWKELGFMTPSAFRKALGQQRVEILTFEIDGRRGTYARTLDVAQWQATNYARGLMKRRER